MRSSAAYTHGGSVWKNLALLLRGIVNTLAFGAVWVGLAFFDAYPWARAVTFGGAAVLVLCIIFQLVLPLVRLPRKRRR